MAVLLYMYTPNTHQNSHHVLPSIQFIYMSAINVLNAGSIHREKSMQYTNQQNGFSIGWGKMRWMLHSISNLLIGSAVDMCEENMQTKFYFENILMIALLFVKSDIYLFEIQINKQCIKYDTYFKALHKYARFIENTGYNYKYVCVYSVY